MNERIAVSEDDANLIYLDNAATTFPKPEGVYEFAYDFYRRYGGNAGRGNNPLARTCSRLLEETRAKTAVWLNSPHPTQVIFTASATHALNLAIFGQPFHVGDTIYVSPFEHNSVLRPVEHLRQTKGIEVKQIPFNRHTYVCELEKLEAMFQVTPPSMVCVTQASNVCGVMPPILDIARLAKQFNSEAVVVVDGAQTAGLYPLPLSEGLIDAFIFSGHKSLYALYGIAGLVLGSEWRPSPIFYGGTGTISESVQMPKQLPSAYEAGSQNILAIAGLHAAVDWLEDVGRESIVNHTMQLAQQLRQELENLWQVELFVPATETNWCGIISFAIEGTTSQAIETALGAQNIAVRAGLHCAPQVHEWLNTTNMGGTIRLSMGYLSKPPDINALMSHLGAMV